MFRCLQVVLALVIAMSIASPLAGQSDNFCMDCIQKQTVMFAPGGSLYYLSDAVCCTAACYGYDGYEMRDADVGWGCLIREVNNELVVGKICNSTNEDLGCPAGDVGDPEDDQPCTLPEGCGNSPIVIDLGQHAYRLTSATHGVLFDIRNNGHPVQIGWTQLGAENTFLALDRNGNGRIDSGAELFGNFTPLQSGALAPNGFVALRELDTNGDSIVNDSDPAWTRLVLWIDWNHDGSSTSDELQPIASSVVTGLETEYRLVGRRDQWGNLFRFMSHVRMAQSRHSYYDVYLAD